MDGWLLAPSPTLAGILMHITVTQHPVLGQEGEAIAWLEPSHVLHVSTSDSTGWANRVRFLRQVSFPLPPIFFSHSFGFCSGLRILKIIAMVIDHFLIFVFSHF